MKFEKKKNVTSAICLSLVMHLGMAVLLVSSLSGNLITHPSIQGMDMVWMSLEDANPKSRMSGKQDLLAQSLSAQEKSPLQQAHAEKSALERESGIIAATQGLSNTAATVKYDMSVNETDDPVSQVMNYGPGQTAGKTSRLSSVIAYPLYKENHPPVYPEIARMRGYEGIVLVAAEVLPNGRVGSMKVRKSSGYAILDQSAIEAVRPWKFEPAKKSGNPFTVWVELPIRFRLDNNS